MATASCLLSEEKFLCSICLDVFTQPVSTPCGHNFCSACIHGYWDSSDISQCPFCKRVFSPRPELHVNVIVSELATEFKKSVRARDKSPDPTETADVLCDICSELKVKAVKSCLTCLASLCETHLEPHQRVAGLKSHRLIDPAGNLVDRMCAKHGKVTELYCRTDRAPVCVSCFKSDHRTHDIVPLEEEYEALVAKKGDAMAVIQKMIQSRSEKITEMENSLDVREKVSEKEKETSVQAFTDLICSLQRSQAELVEAIEERHRAEKEKVEGFLQELRREVVELGERSSQLEMLSQSGDHHLFLRNFPTLCAPMPKDWTDVSVGGDLSFEAARGAVTRLKQRVDEVMEEVPEIKMKRMREHAVDLTLDPDTAYCTLVISQDGKQVKDGCVELNPPKNPKRFEICPEVLAKEGFTTGKFYYEVQVKGKTSWTVGVVRDSVNRKVGTTLSVSLGFWIFKLDAGQYSICVSNRNVIKVKEKLEKVGIFVDYDKGVVSFYNVDSKSHIYSYTGHWFTEKLYPYFSPEMSENGSNSAPLIITPVAQTH